MEKESFVSRLKAAPKQRWILILIVAVGAFLRSYHFSSWLYFYPDQARDVMLAGNVLSGKSPWPLLGPIAASTPFRLGPIYYYFQIISGKLFGVTPASMAYPDLLFSILSIPLLYVFLRKIFNKNLSLALTGLYACCFYAIRYSRFAWNSNPIPFFVLLFFLALFEFIWAKNKTQWGWVVALGVALGVGVQLHTVLLVLLPAATLLALAYTLKQDPKVWKKWAAIFLLALALNGGQIASELGSNFRNTRYFVSVLDDRSPSESTGMASSLALNVICHAQADVLFLTSLENNDDCDTPAYFRSNQVASNAPSGHWFIDGNIAAGLFIFLAGYGLLVYYLRKERDEKKKLFLVLNLIYGTLTFLILLPVIGHNGQVRYCLPIIFLPFLFLGLMAKYLSEVFPKKYYWLGGVVLAVLVGINFSTIIAEARQYSAGTRSNHQFVVLGELEKISAYIESQSSPQKEAYIFGGQKYMQNFYNPLYYVTSQDGFTVVRGGRNPKDVPAGSSIFFIDQNPDSAQISEYDASPSQLGFTVESYKSFGNIGIYKVAN